MKQRVVYVDVDDTLVHYAGTKRVPLPSVIARVRTLHEQGEQIYLWSSGGADYARTVAVELGLEECFVAFLPKPEMYIDDQAVDEWLYCEHSLPGGADTY